MPVTLDGRIFQATQAVLALTADDVGSLPRLKIHLERGPFTPRGHSSTRWHYDDRVSWHKEL